MNYHTPNVPKPVKKPKPVIEKIQFTEEQKEDIKKILEGYQRSDVTLRRTRSTFHTSTEYKIQRIRKITGGFCCRCSKFNTHLLKYKIDGATIVERFCEQHVPTP